jgi:hypothetical protein
MFFIIDFGLLVCRLIFTPISIFFFLKKKNKNGDFSSLLSHSAVIIFNAIIWDNTYFDFSEEGERRKEKGERLQRKGKE